MWVKPLDPSWTPLLEKRIIVQGNRKLIKFGDQTIDYDDGFRLYLTTPLSNPHYLPETCILVTLINFMVTLPGLEQQLLGHVVRHECSSLETKNDKLTVQMASDTKQLVDIEDKILDLLSKSSGNILDDETLIRTLDEAKVTANVIQERVEIAQETAKEIAKAREEYRPIAKRGALIYFVIADLSVLDPMYQYSLPYFISLFQLVLEVTPAQEVLADRISILLDNMRSTVFKTICRGLFERHKHLFAFILCTTLTRNDTQSIPPHEWEFFTKSLIPSSARPIPESLSPFLSQSQWLSIIDLESTCSSPFQGLTQHFIDSTQLWKKWIRGVHDDLDDTCVTCPPPKWTNLTLFQHLCLLKCVREDCLTIAIPHFYSECLW